MSETTPPKPAPFDVQREFELDVRSPEGLPVLTLVRWPSDQEWSQRIRAIKHIQTDLGRGIKQFRTLHNSEADFNIYEKIKLNGAPAIEPEEATRLLDIMAKCDVRDVSFV